MNKRYKLRRLSMAWWIWLLLRVGAAVACFCVLSWVETTYGAKNDLGASGGDLGHSDVVRVVSIPDRVEVSEPVEAGPGEGEAGEPGLDVAGEYALEAEYIAKTIYGEARGCTEAEQAKVAWCILNRVDHEDFPDSIIEVVTQYEQFRGYRARNPVTEEHYALALDVIAKWRAEKEAQGLGSHPDRNLGPEYVYFYGDGRKNHFRKEYR